MVYLLVPVRYLRWNFVVTRRCTRNATYVAVLLLIILVILSVVLVVVFVLVPVNGSCGGIRGNT